MNVAIAGATGYTGLELVRILSRHPEVDIAALTSERYAGKQYSEIFPQLSGHISCRLDKLDSETIADKADVLFLALPHCESMRHAPFFYRAGKKIIDLSADFRFIKKKNYESWYQKHAAPDLLAEAVYGLCEINRPDIERAQFIANPGCYPTSIILPLMPFLREDLISRSSIIADSKSGVSGAGRGLKTSSLFCEVGESFRAYSIHGHRHQPEIEEQLESIAQVPVSITFSPHLVPMNRGMLSTIYVTLKKKLPADDIYSLLNKYYAGEPFIRLHQPGTLPHTGWVTGTNYCDIGFSLRDKKLVLVSAIDNLVKGASGQAVQNMNIMLGLPENTALDHLPVYP